MMATRLATLLLATLLPSAWALCLPAQPPEQAEGSNLAWPQWRGPERDAIVSGPTWPQTLNDDALTKLWSVPLGPSYSGPILSETMVFSTETRDEQFEVAYAFDRETGEELWRTEWEGSIRVPFFAASNGSWIRSTPAFDGERLYVAGMRDVLVCLDAATGEELWRVDFVEEFDTPLPNFGFVCSPLLEGEHVYVQAGAAVVKLNKRTGDIVWRTLEDDGGMMGSAFSSPNLATLAGQRQLLVQTRQDLAGVDLETGDVLWQQEVPSFRGMNILTPVPVGDTIFTSTYQNGSWLYRIGQQEDGFTVTEDWSNNAQGYMSTPVVIDGHIYMHLQNERFACIDLATGERTWTSTPYAAYASLIAQGDRILALCSDGNLMLIQANPAEFELLGEVPVSETETWAHLAIDANVLYIREQDALTAFRWERE